MIFGIYDPPTAGGAIKSWPELRVGTVVNATEIEYDKQFCGVGTFELYVPIGSRDADKLGLGKFLFSSDGYFIIKQMIYGADNIIVSGTDLNGMLLDRLTVAKTEDGKDKISGSTEYIVKHFVEVNCTSAADTGRAFPGLTIAANRNRGIANDAASPRLEIVADVISDILSAQQMGWRINAVNLTATSTTTLFEFEVYESVDRTAGTERPKTFSYGFGNADSIKTESSIANAKNTLYCELGDGTVQTYSPVSDNVGFGRTEEYADLGCELSELEVYAKHEIAGRFAAVENMTLEHVDSTGFGDSSTLDGFDLGDIVTVFDNNANMLREALISSVKIKRTGENALELATEESAAALGAAGGTGGKSTHSLSITVGGTRAKPLDRVAKAADTVSSAVKSIMGTLNVIKSDSNPDRLVKNSCAYTFTPVSVTTRDGGDSSDQVATTGIGARLDFYDNKGVRHSYFVMSDLYVQIEDVGTDNYSLSLGTPTTEFYDYKRKQGFKINNNHVWSFGFGESAIPLNMWKDAAGSLHLSGFPAIYLDDEVVWSNFNKTYSTSRAAAQNVVQPAKDGAVWTYEEDGIHINFNGRTAVIPWNE